MRQMGLQGAMRARKVRTTVSNPAAPCPLDRVNRQCHAKRPNALWMSDFTFVATWQGFVYVTFILNAYALRVVGCRVVGWLVVGQRVVGWRVSRTAHVAFVLDALKHALADRCPVQGGGLSGRSDHGVQGKFN